MGATLALIVIVVVRLIRRRRLPPWWTYVAVGLGWVVLGALTYANLTDRSRWIKANVDVRQIAGAIREYYEHCGGFPPPGEAQTTTCVTTKQPQAGAVPFALTLEQTNEMGHKAGPFRAGEPSVVLAVPKGWTGAAGAQRTQSVTWRAYQYVIRPSETFVVCAAGDGTVASVPPGQTCPSSP